MAFWIVLTICVTIVILANYKFGCKCQHEIIEKGDKTHPATNAIKGKFYISRCPKCGDIKKDEFN